MPRNRNRAPATTREKRRRQKRQTRWDARYKTADWFAAKGVEVSGGWSQFPPGAKLLIGSEL